MEQAVQAAQVNEHAVLGDVLGLALHNLALGEGLEELLALVVALLFKQHAAGHDDVAAAAVDFEDAELVFLVHQGVHVRNGAQIDMGAGQEGFHATDVDGVATLDAAHDLAADGFVVFLDPFKLVKYLHALGLFKGEGDGAFHLVFADDVDVDFVANLHRYIARYVAEFTGGDLAFALEVHIHQNCSIVNLDYLARGERALFEVAEI